MSDIDVFERNLASTFHDYADWAPTEIDAAALSAAITKRHPRRVGVFGIMARGRFAWLKPMVIALLLLLALVAAVLVGARILRNQSPNFSPLVVRPVAFMTQQRDGAAAVRLADGRVLIVGGTNSYAGGNINYAEIFDPASESFQPIGDVPPASVRGQTATLLRDGSVLITGGYAAGTASRSALLFEPTTGSFRQLPDMNSARFNHAAVELSDGRVALIGGVTDRSSGPLIEYFDPATELFTPGPDWQGPVFTSPGAFSIGNGQVFVLAKAWATAGGTIPAGLILDFVTQSLEPVQSGLSETASGPATYAAQFADGRIAIVVHDGGGAKPTDDLVAYNGATESYSSLTRLGGVVLLSPTLLADGRLLLAESNSEDCYTVFAEIYNPYDNSLVRAGQIPGIGNCQARPLSSITALSDGSALIAGGRMSSGEETSAASVAHP